MANERVIHKCIYQHFKGGRYQVLEIAEHTETGEKMVVYKALYPENWGKVYVRPYVMFALEVDREKYPDVKQRYRFERVNDTELLSGQKMSCSLGVRREECT